jgi:hypothetical protein
MGRDMGIITPQMVALEATTMEENSTPAKVTTAILMAMEVMAVLFPTEANTPLIRILTLDVMCGLAMVTTASAAGRIMMVATTPQVAIWAMTSTEADIMVLSIMVEVMMSAVPRSTTADMAATKEVTANTQETITVAIDVGEDNV